MNSLDYLIVGFYAVALIAIATLFQGQNKAKKRHLRIIFWLEDHFHGGLLEPH